MINPNAIEFIRNAPIETNPFNHLVIDDFFDANYAETLSTQFPDYENPLQYKYENPLEVKRAMNFWDRFPPETYNTFWTLCQQSFADLLGNKFHAKLQADIGLNGAGWHMHGRGGKLNVHKDYSIHPKIYMQRKLNIIIYLSKDWNPEWGGCLEFWSHDAERDRPKEMIVKTGIKFNRAVIFDTTQNSWHGFYEPMTCPEGVYRKSLALYYVQTPDANADTRKKVLYAPSKDQENDASILAMINIRKGVVR